MQQDPTYLKNQSREGHKLYRRNRRFLNVSTLLWFIFWFSLFVISAIDRAAGLGWGYAGDEWAKLGFAAFAPCFWVFGTLIVKLVRSFIRGTYGPDPGD